MFIETLTKSLRELLEDDFRPHIQKIHPVFFEYLADFSEIFTKCLYKVVFQSIEKLKHQNNIQKIDKILEAKDKFEFFLEKNISDVKKLVSAEMMKERVDLDKNKGNKNYRGWRGQYEMERRREVVAGLKKF